LHCDSPKDIPALLSKSRRDVSSHKPEIKIKKSQILNIFRGNSYHIFKIHLKDDKLLLIKGGVVLKTKIITDSSNDLPEEILNKYDIKFAPLTIAFDKEIFHDGANLTRDEFYSRLIGANQIPQTSQPSPRAFYELIDEVLNERLDVVIITLSSGLSGTYSSAVMAKDMFPAEKQKRIYIVDTLSASTGQGLLVYEAAKMAQKGMAGAEIVENIEQMKRRLAAIFTVDTFEYLLKGGRVTKVQAFFGTVLDVKPILTLNSEGKIEALGKVRGRKRAVAKLLDIMAEEGEDLKNQIVGVVHSRAPEDAMELANVIKSRFDVKEVIIGELSASIGTHTGPGCLAVFFYR
jgi:DegV family protein with EDD domain